MDSRIEEVLDSFSELKLFRDSIDDICLEASQYICPDRGRFQWDKLKHDSVGNESKIIDSTSGDALEISANGMHSGLTPPSRRWFQLAFQDDDLNKYKPYTEWMDILTDRVYSILRRSNFYSSMHSCYTEILLFSTMAMHMAEDMLSGVRYRPLTFGEYWIAGNSDQRVDMLMRAMVLTEREMEQSFGEKALSGIRVSSHKDKWRTYKVLHVVRPRKNLDPSKLDSLNKRFESMYIYLGGLGQDNGYLISEGGFDIFPYVVGRYLLVGNNPYGFGSPGLRKLPDIKMLQQMETACLDGIQKEIDPPVAAPMSLFGQAIYSEPGGITWVADTNSSATLKPLYDVRLNIQAAELKSEQIRQRIQKGFYVDIFRMLEGLKTQTGNVTATQIMEMQSEKMLTLGPFIERMEDEILDPIIDFIVSIIMSWPDRYQLPPPPPELMQQPYKIDYISILAQAQKMMGIRAMDDLLQYTLSASQVRPEIADNIDFDEAIRYRADLIGLPSKLTFGEEEVSQVRQARQQAMEQEREAAFAEQGVKMARDVGSIPTENPNMLTELLSGITGEA